MSVLRVRWWGVAVLAAITCAGVGAVMLASWYVTVHGLIVAG